MAITKSAKKSIRQNKRRRDRNKSRKRKIKTLTRKVRDLVKEGKTKEAKEVLPSLYKALDKAAKSGVIKKNNANRKKARITRLINSKS